MHQNHKYAYSASNGWIGHRNTLEKERKREKRERERERDQCQTDDIDSSIDNFI